MRVFGDDGGHAVLSNKMEESNRPSLETKASDSKVQGTRQIAVMAKNYIRLIRVLFSTFNKKRT